jgi:hypothetical protein
MDNIQFLKKIGLYFVTENPTIAKHLDRKHDFFSQNVEPTFIAATDVIMQKKRIAGN